MNRPRYTAHCRFGCGAFIYRSSTLDCASFSGRCDCGARVAFVRAYEPGESVGLGAQLRAIGATDLTLLPAQPQDRAEATP